MVNKVCVYVCTPGSPYRIYTANVDPNSFTISFSSTPSQAVLVAYATYAVGNDANYPKC